MAGGHRGCASRLLAGASLLPRVSDWAKDESCSIVRDLIDRAAYWRTATLFIMHVADAGHRRLNCELSRSRAGTAFRSNR